MINKLQKTFLLPLSLLIVFYFLNVFLRNNILTTTTFYYSLEKIFLFNTLLSFIVIVIICQINKKYIDKVGFTFLGLSILKMVFSIFFLFPLIQSNFENKIPDVLTFFLCYFIFLFTESFIVIKGLNHKN